MTDKRPRLTVTSAIGCDKVSGSFADFTPTVLSSLEAVEEDIWRTWRNPQSFLIFDRNADTYRFNILTSHAKNAPADRRTRADATA